MKLKRILSVAILFTAISLYTGVSITYADEETDTLENGYAANSKLVAAERTDAYAMDTFKNKGILTDPLYADVVKKSKEITEGFTSEYEKVKAIHDWVSTNIWYDVDSMGKYSDYDSAYDVLQGRRALCDGFTNLTIALMQAAGFPAKYISGETNSMSDAWAEVWVDNRWVFVDTEADCENIYMNNKYSEKLPCDENRFDLSVAEYSKYYMIDSNSFKQVDADAWDGSLLFYDIENDRVFKKIKNYPLNGLVISTYGYKAKDLYADVKHTKHWNLAKDRVDSENHIVFVKRPGLYGVTYYLKVDDFLDYYKIEKVPNHTKLKAPKAPTKKGYIFIGWYDENGKKWNFKNNKINGAMVLIAHWKKK